MYIKELLVWFMDNLWIFWSVGDKSFVCSDSLFITSPWVLNWYWWRKIIRCSLLHCTFIHVGHRTKCVDLTWMFGGGCWVSRGSALNPLNNYSLVTVAGLGSVDLPMDPIPTWSFLNLSFSTTMTEASLKLWFFLHLVLFWNKIRRWLVSCWGNCQDTNFNIFGNNCQRDLMSRIGDDISMHEDNNMNDQLSLLQKLCKIRGEEAKCQRGKTTAKQRDLSNPRPLPTIALIRC